MGLILDTNGSRVGAEVRSESFRLSGEGWTLELNYNWLPHLVHAVKMLEHETRSQGDWDSAEERAIIAGPLAVPRLERFPQDLWPDGPGGGPYTKEEIEEQNAHIALWRAQEKDCTCDYRDGDWLRGGHAEHCPRHTKR